MTASHFHFANNLAPAREVGREQPAQRRANHMPRKAINSAQQIRHGLSGQNGSPHPKSKGRQNGGHEKTKWKGDEDEKHPHETWAPTSLSHLKGCARRLTNCHVT